LIPLVAEKSTITAESFARPEESRAQKLRNTNHVLAGMYLALTALSGVAMSCGGYRTFEPRYFITERRMMPGIKALTERRDRRRASAR
jgi:hypothetical protein